MATGAIFPTDRHGTRFGNQFLYQAAIGRNICGSPRWIYAWMVEFDGIYSWKNKIDSKKDPNSGGNILYITPSIWISSRKLILQFGIGYPIVQNLFGNQSKQYASINFNFGWTL